MPWFSLHSRKRKGVLMPAYGENTKHHHLIARACCVPHMHACPCECTGTSHSNNPRCACHFGLGTQERSRKWKRREAGVKERCSEKYGRKRQVKLPWMFACCELLPRSQNNFISNDLGFLQERRTFLLSANNYFSK